MGARNVERVVGWAPLCSFLALPPFVASLVVLRVVRRGTSWATRFALSLAFAIRRPARSSVRCTGRCHRCLLPRYDSRHAVRTGLLDDRLHARADRDERATGS